MTIPAALAKKRDALSAKECIYEPKWGGKDHSGYDTLMKYEVNGEREDAFCNGFDSCAEILLTEIEVMRSALKIAESYMFQACQPNQGNLFAEFDDKNRSSLTRINAFLGEE